MRFKTFFLTHYFSIRLSLVVSAMLFSYGAIWNPHPFTTVLCFIFILGLLASIVLEVAFDEQNTAAFERIEQRLMNAEPMQKGAVECDVCGHDWIAMYPIDAQELECPKCHQMAKIE